MEADIDQGAMFFIKDDWNIFMNANMNIVDLTFKDGDTLKSGQF